jgi:hypothetical protein
LEIAKEGLQQGNGMDQPQGAKTQPRKKELQKGKKKNPPQGAKMQTGFSRRFVVHNKKVLDNRSKQSVSLKEAKRTSN